MKSPPDAQDLHPAFGGLSLCALIGRRGILIRAALSFPNKRPLPHRGDRWRAIRDAAQLALWCPLSNSPSKRSAQPLHRQTGTCLLKHKSKAYQTGTCLLNYKYEAYQTGTCLLNHKFGAYQTGACLLNHNFEAYQTGTLNTQRTLRKTDYPPERPQNPRRKAKPRAAFCPRTRRLTLLPFLCRAFPHPQQVLPTNKRMGRQHETE